ncbi:MAG TPA: M64 family metallopeptidase [Mycobacteriales bacterium]|nr:M64 family metallopeptidase [Mycobacteriales bacterium]
MRLAAVFALPLIAVSSLAAAEQPPAAPAYEVREVFSPDGRIERVRVPVALETSAAERSRAAAAATGVVPLQVSGPAETTFDLVVVGDGYTAAEQPVFHRHASSKVDELFSIEPFRSYRGVFNVWLVEVVSAESGVDNDPLPGTSRDTVLDMQFWCNGTERLLCVNQSKALAAAEELVPDVDHVLALGNSAKYGGAGGKVATASGGHAKAGQVAIHELGHSIGKLADEYDSPYLIPHVGDAPEANATVYPEQVMVPQQLKWWRWFGQSTPDGGTIGSHLGGRYNPVVYYRPSANSIMRSLGREFNVVGREEMVLGFYELARPLLTASPAAAARRGATLRITTPRVGTLRITWSIDGRVVARDVTELDLRTEAGPRGAFTVEVQVADTTPWVLPTHPRAELLVETASWQVG